MHEVLGTGNQWVRANYTFKGQQVVGGGGLRNAGAKGEYVYVRVYVLSWSCKFQLVPRLPLLSDTLGRSLHLRRQYSWPSL